jgi:glutathione S-transferase
MAAGGLTLWGVGTPRTMRAHWMLIEFGLDYEMRPIKSRGGETMTPEFLALNPRHKVPVLSHGDLVLAESFAIVTYLSETFDAPDGFFVPHDAPRRAKLNEWCSFAMMELDALSLYVIRRHLDLADEYGAAPNVIDAAREYFAEQTAALFEGAAASPDHLMPEGMSVADILMTTVVDSALRRGIATPAFLVRYHARMTKRPAYRAAFERNFSDRPFDPASQG